MRTEILTCDVCGKNVKFLAQHVFIEGVLYKVDQLISFTAKFDFTSVTRDQHGCHCGTYQASRDICHDCAERLFLEALKVKYPNLMKGKK